MRTLACMFTCVVCLLATPTWNLAAQEQRPRYDLDLTFDRGAGEISGRMTLRLPSGWTTARLDLTANLNRPMRVDSILAQGRRMDVPRPDSADVIEVSLPDGARELVVHYVTPMDSAWLQPFGYYLMAPLGARRWVYPALVTDIGREHISDFQVRLDFPAELTIYTTGGEGEAQRRANRQRVSYDARAVRGFGIVAGEGYRVERHEGGGVPVVAFFHPDHEERFRFVVERTIEAAGWYRRTYGFFPLEQVGIIQGHPRWGGGYPLPNMFAIHLGNLADDHLAWITAHELGHYYWGYTVLTEASRELDWLQLALGIWADQRYLAERAGMPLDAQFRRDRGQGAALVDYFEALAGGHDQRLNITPADEAEFDFPYHSIIRHGKAATGIYLQSMVMGPDRFLDLQRRILRDYAGRPLPHSEFIALLAANGAPDAAAFFDAWARDNARIDIVVDAVEPDPAGGWRVLLQRTGNVPYPVTVELALPSGPVRHIVRAPAERDTLRVGQRPTAIAIDPDGLIPTSSSGNIEMRAAIAAGLDRARRDEPFIHEARAILEALPDDHDLRSRLAQSLFRLGRFEEAAATWPSGRRGCRTRSECTAGIYAARALEMLGDARGATRLANALEPDARRTGVLPALAGLRARLAERGAGMPN